MNPRIITRQRYDGIGLTGPLRIELLPDGRSARLIEPFRVRALGHVIEAQMGFETDFASVPRLLWRLVPPWGRYSEAAVVHDWLYRRGRLSRREADAVFLDLMGRLKISWLERRAIWGAVRLFGWIAWVKNRG